MLVRLTTRFRPAGPAAALAALLGLASGCYERIAVDRFPPGALQVRFVEAGGYSDCLVASAVMCANYVTASQQFTSAKLRSELEAAGLDPTRIADVRDWLAERRLVMQPLTGSFSDTPLTGLGWWLLQGGYPVICVINKFAGNADYNHAVVVIGIGGGAGLEQAEVVYCLDPASPRRLVRFDRLTFRHLWASAGNMMLPVFERSRAVAGNTTKPGVSP